MKSNGFISVNRRDIRLCLLSILSISFLFIGCKQDEYSIKDLDTEMTVGGDSLLLPIGSTKPIRLDSMINKQNIDLLKKSQDGSYSLHKGDSSVVTVKAVDPVTFSIAPITVTPSVVSFADLKFPTFNIDPITSQSTFNTPSFTVDKSIVAINDTAIATASLNIIKPGVPGQQRAKASYPIIPFVASKTKSFTQEINIDTYPTELNKVYSVILKDNLVTITMDKKEINNRFNWENRTETVSMKIDFPSQYIISTESTNTNPNISVEGTSFVVKNDVLSTSDLVTYRFHFDRLDVENVPQNKSLKMTNTITCNFTYTISGSLIDATGVNTTPVNIGMRINVAPSVSDLDIQSNSIALSMEAGNSSIDQVITGIPPEVSYIKNVTFEDGASVLLSFNDPNILPFALSDGHFEINLPKSIIFKPTANLNSSTNVLTMPYNTLFTPKKLEVLSMNINKNIVKGSKSFTLNELLSYKAVNITLGSIRTSLTTVQSFGSKDMKIGGVFSGFKVKDAAVTTDEITATVPSKTSEIKIDKFVSLDVKKLFSATLINPSLLKLKLSVTGLPAAIDSLFFRNYTIKFPSTLNFKAGTVNAANEIVLNRGFKVSEGFLKTLSLESFDFGVSGNTLNNGTFNLKESVSLSGEVYIKGTNLNASDMNSVTVNPSIEIGDMSIAVVEALVAPVLEETNKQVTINLPDFLKQDGTKLDILNPVITFEVGNTTGIPIDLTLDLIPKRKGVAIASGIIHTGVSVAAATVLGKHTWSNFWIAPTDAGISAGYSPLIITNLSDLLKTVPDEIEVKVKPVVAGTKHRVDLQSTLNQLKIRYNINLPLDFGKDFKVLYNDTIADLQSNIKDVLKYINNDTTKIELLIVADNEIPLDLNLELVPLDKNKLPMSGLVVNQMGTIKSCNINGTAQKSVINLGLKVKTIGAVADLDAFALKVSASKNSTIAGLPLNAAQSVKMALKVRVAGITLK
jgi:hypothetical protein